MAENSAIEWCTHTQNWWIGCTKLTLACDNCYAETWGKRFGVEWGNHPRRRTSDANWRKPLVWNKAAKASGVRARVFTNSLADFFDNQVDEAWRVEAWQVIRQCDALDWLILTKRPQNIAPMLPTGWGAGWPHIWLGTTVENQQEADRRIPHLLAIPAAVRFLSCEPLLGPVDLRPWLSEDDGCEECDDGDGMGAPRCHGAGLPRAEQCPRNYAVFRTEEGPRDEAGTPEWVGVFRETLNWVICGGESGPTARPMHPDWARDLRDQCRTAKVPFFFKQWGEWAPPTDSLDALDWPYHPDHERTHWFDARPCARPIERGWSDKYHGGGGALPPPPFDLFKTPEYLDQVARCPQSECREVGKCVGNKARAAATRIGKKAAGALLDGREWRQMPQPAGATP